MQLSAFIHNTLSEIVLGVHLAHARSLDLAAIAPNTINKERVGEKTYVDFDVAVAVSEQDTTTRSGGGKTGAEIQVASIVKANIGVSGKIEAGSTTSTEQTSRVVFRVPIYFGVNYEENEAAR